MLEQHRRGAPGADSGERVPQILERLSHAHSRLGHGFLDHRLPLPLAARETVEPTFSPITTRLRFPKTLRLKTTMGRLLFIQSEMAVVSITSKRRDRTSR